MTELLPLTEHNLDYFLEAYDRERQPMEMKVPYDQWGNEIVIPAPPRDDVQRAVLEFDFKTFFGGDRIKVGFLDDTGYSKRVRIVDPQNLELESEKISEELVICRPGTTYLYSTRRETERGLERLSYAVRQFYRSKDGKCKIEHLDVSL